MVEDDPILLWYGEMSITIAVNSFSLDYCDVYLTHDAPRVRRDHNAGWKHAAQVKAHFLCTTFLVYELSISFYLALNQDKMARQIGEIVKDYEARGGMIVHIILLFSNLHV